MAGTVASVGIAGVGAALLVALAGVGGAAVVAQRASAAADAAALAAADAASGALPGVPCERADELAAAAGATVVSCELDDLVATISVSVPWGMLAATASARAGPPP